MQALLDAVAREGYLIYGPTVSGRAVVYDRISSADDLPRGWVDHQEGGTYRLEQTDRRAFFGFTTGAQAWKAVLFPPEQRLWQAERKRRNFQVLQPEPDQTKRALVGVRPCDLAAIRIHDRVLAEGPYPDTQYMQRRERALIVAVNCSDPGGTCFCASMQTGPEAAEGFDLLLTEVVESDRHYFVIESGSAPGQKVLDQIQTKPAGAEELKAAAAVLEDAAGRMGRDLKTEGLREVLNHAVEHPRWEEIAERCLSCGNCTLICPTCFCTTVRDCTDLSGHRAERTRTWDSCFTVDFSYIYGGSIRPSASARYRQWMRHKLATWVDQYGMFGCVGCGRCITWCPVGIDITEEARGIRESEEASGRKV